MKKSSMIGVCIITLILVMSLAIPTTALGFEDPEWLPYLSYDCSEVPQQSTTGQWEVLPGYTQNSEWSSDGEILFIDAYHAEYPNVGGAGFFRYEPLLARDGMFEIDVRARFISYEPPQPFTAPVYLGFAIGDGVKTALVWSGLPENGQIAVQGIDGQIITPTGVTDWFSFNTYSLIVDKSSGDPDQYMAWIYVNHHLVLEVSYWQLPNSADMDYLPEDPLFAFGGAWSDTEWDFVNYCEVETGAKEYIRLSAEYIQSVPEDAFSGDPDIQRRQLSNQLDGAERLIDFEAYSGAMEGLYNVYQKMDGSLTPDNSLDDLNDWITDPDAQEYLTEELHMAIYQLWLLDNPELTGRQSSPSLNLLINPEPYL